MPSESQLGQKTEAFGTFVYYTWVAATWLVAPPVMILLASAALFGGEAVTSRLGAWFAFDGLNPALAVLDQGLSFTFKSILRIVAVFCVVLIIHYMVFHYAANKKLEKQQRAQRRAQREAAAAASASSSQ